MASVTVFEATMLGLLFDNLNWRINNIVGDLQADHAIDFCPGDRNIPTHFLQLHITVIVIIKI